ncbi:uncharacterized protein LOC141856678 [Brevipalpus obovatus]|uniref:uncharacterized protein LOC141856678 n=1 Tax=Brevipalpus obovatus TaxID=246614 RepID=UPI003D9DBDB0
MDEDLFDQDADDLDIGSKEYEKLGESISKDGFRDGVDEGKQDGLQKGFDYGFEQVFPIIEAVNFLKGLCKVMFESRSSSNTRDSESTQKSSTDNDASISSLHYDLMSDLNEFQESVLNELEKTKEISVESRSKFNVLKTSAIKLHQLVMSNVDRGLIESCSLSPLKEEENG